MLVLVANFLEVVIKPGSALNGGAVNGLGEIGDDSGVEEEPDDTDCRDRLV